MVTAPLTSADCARARYAGTKRFWIALGSPALSPLPYLSIPPTTVGRFLNDHLSLLVDSSGDLNLQPLENAFVLGAMVTITAEADSGQSFLGWSGDASGTNNPLSLALSENLVITGHFTKRPKIEALNCGGVHLGSNLPLVIRGDPEDVWLAERGVPNLKQQWVQLHYGKQNPKFNPAAVNLTGTA